MHLVPLVGDKVTGDLCEGHINIRQFDLTNSENNCVICRTEGIHSHSIATAFHIL